LHEVDHGVVLGELAETRLTVDAPGEYCAVTIGIGAGFSEMAGRHGETVRRAFGCDGLVVLGEDMLDAWCPSQSLFPDVARRVFWLKFCIPLICPGLKRWVYCDADYRIVGDVDAVVLEQVRHDERLIAVRDSWSDGALPYYNAGFYVANRKQHSGLLEWCRSNYFGVREVFGEQCVWNAGIRALGLDVLELPGAYNVRTEGECERNRVVGAHGFWWRG
jgi:hypothetical protein